METWNSRWFDTEVYIVMVSIISEVEFGECWSILKRIPSAANRKSLSWSLITAPFLKKNTKIHAFDILTEIFHPFLLHNNSLEGASSTQQNPCQVFQIYFDLQEHNSGQVESAFI